MDRLFHQAVVGQIPHTPVWYQQCIYKWINKLLDDK
ncbi:uncharacterized protein METZ01_LOCUS192030 [marine metagenome]|uniref:Uncharacterized protein n=1 Tax=marine metagenome TaxID=408172 RepID=A0A382DL07_9ZZZZ